MMMSADDQRRRGENDVTAILGTISSEKRVASTTECDGLQKTIFIRFPTQNTI